MGDVCTEKIPGVCPSVKLNLDWGDWAWVHLTCPCLAQVALSVVFFVLVGPLYRKAFRQNSRMRNFCRLYIGTIEREPERRSDWLSTLFLAQIVGSAVAVIVWITLAYKHESSELTRMLLFITSLMDLSYWMYNRLRGELSVQSLWQWRGLVDMLTTVPTWVLLISPEARKGGADWLTLHFLRPLAILQSFSKVQSEGPLAYLGVMAQVMMINMLRVFCLIMVMAGMIFTSEVLGDPPIFYDSFVETQYGDKVSFLQMVYWIMITITTVGYGDFAPRGALSRILTALFIVIGVACVFHLQFIIDQAWSQWREGSGTYRPHKKGEQHVVVILCLKGRALNFSSMVAGFLTEILHTSQAHNWPNVVIFAPSQWDEGHNWKKAHTFEEFMRTHGFYKNVQRRVWFIVGELTSKVDLDRAGVGEGAITFLLADVNSDTPDKDDEQNIFTAMVLREYYPGVRLRLMLLRPQSKELAVQSGIEISRCFSLRELKANILAQNVRCHGLLPMITGMLSSVDPVKKQSLMRGLELGALGTGDDSWMKSYAEGLERSIYGFELHDRFKGMTFGELATAIFEEVGAIVIAIFEDGRLNVCPQRSHKDPMKTGLICFAVASDVSVLDTCRLPGLPLYHWRSELVASRDLQLKKAIREGPHVAAAMLMGSMLKESLLPEDEVLGDMETGAQGYSDSDSSDGSDGLDVPGEFIPASRKGTLTLGRRTEEHESRIQVQRLRHLRASIGSFEHGSELVVVIVCQGSVWQQVRTFVNALRANYLPVFNPIVVFAPSNPPPRLFEGCDDQVFCHLGECTKIKALIEAGVLEAGAVVVMTGEAPKLDTISVPLFRDSTTVLCAQELECWCGLSRKEVYTTYELQESSAVRHLPRLMKKHAVRLERLIAEKGGEDSDSGEDVEHDATARSTAFSAMMRNISPATPRTSNAAHDRDVTEQTSILFNSRFAAGQVFSPELWGNMLGRMYHMPVIIELVEALVMPHRRGQASFPWQIRVPDAYVGLPFMELFRDLALGGWDDACDNAGRPRPSTTNSTDTEKRRQPKAGPAVAVALYRRRDEMRRITSVRREDAGAGSGSVTFCDPPRNHQNDEDPAFAPGTGGYNYTILAPEPDTILRCDDLVFVLGSRRFGKEAHDRRLLRGEGEQYRSDAEDENAPDKAASSPCFDRQVSTESELRNAASNHGKERHSDPTLRRTSITHNSSLGHPPAHHHHHHNQLNHQQQHHNGRHPRHSSKDSLSNANLVMNISKDRRHSKQSTDSVSSSIG